MLARSLRRKLSKEMAWAGIRALSVLLPLLGRKRALSLASRLGEVAFELSSKREMAIRRCALVLGVGEARAREVVRRSFVNMARSAAEFLLAPYTGREEVLSLVRGYGLRNLEEALSLGRGAIVVTAHLGNWEMLAAFMAARGFRVNGLAADQRDERITHLIERLRSSWGVKTVSKDRALRGAVECLEEGEVLGVLLDQEVGSAFVVAPFLGFDAYTPSGVLKLASRRGIPLLPIFIVRDGSDPMRHRAYFLRPRLFSGERLEEQARWCNEVLSRWIRAFPDQWMWVSDRWEKAGSLRALLEVSSGP